MRHGIVYGALTGVFIAAYTVLDGFSVKVMLIAPIILDYFGNLLRLLILSPAVLRNRARLAHQWRRNRRLAFGVGVLSPLSYILVLYAMQTAPVSYVAPARELSMMIAAVFGVKLLQEPDAAARMLGAGFIASGVIALALG